MKGGNIWYPTLVGFISPVVPPLAAASVVTEGNVCRYVLTYIIIAEPSCLRFDRHATACACRRVFDKAGIKIDINNAITPTTTSSSTNVKPSPRPK